MFRLVGGNVKVTGTEVELGAEVEVPINGNNFNAAGFMVMINEKEWFDTHFD